MTRRRTFAVEVIQSSAMDCGPAALKCLLDGHGIAASYGRLREACQTDVDGTSINTLEDIANALGLDAHQTMMPVDHLLLKSPAALPALIVIRQPGGSTHYVVIWRRAGRFLQLMDPATGRRWVTATRFLRDVFIHEQAISAGAWRRWAGSTSSAATLRERLTRLAIAAPAATALIEAAAADPGWRSFAALDAAIRLVQTLADAGTIAHGQEAQALIQRLVAAPQLLPPHVWSVSAPDAVSETVAASASGDDETVRLRGAVFVRVSGTKAAASSLSPELAAALSEPPSRPGRTLLRLLAEDGALAPSLIALAMLWAAAGTMIEAVLLRGLFDLGRELQLVGQRLAAYSAVVVFAAALLLVEFPVAAGLLRLGRQLETRLRLRFLEKIPRLGDRYFQSRPKSDMAERSHSLHRIRHLPELAGRLVRSGGELLFTTAGIIWLDPASAPIALTALAAMLALPLVVQPTLAEQDLRLRTHTGALGRFYLDAMLGVVAIRTHGAEKPVRQAHRQLLGEWAGAGLRFQRTVAAVEGAQLLVGFGFAAWLIFAQFSRAGDTGRALLLVYWALSLPAIAQDLGLAAWQYPSFRSIALRLLEPLGALQETAAASATTTTTGAHDGARAGAAIELSGVTVRAAGHTILQDISLRIAPGTHVAVIGRSGAGKSSFVGLLLGWHRPAAGSVVVDDEPLAGAALDRLRSDTAWVEPEVHLWNRTLLDNLAYGAPGPIAAGLGDAITQSELVDVLERLPAGLQTPLGEAGARLSGGEGQRVRVGRALLRRDARLVILDEPFRGLERERRAALLDRCRAHWRHATFICITHDVGHTRAFDRVLVAEEGRIVEDAPPAALEAQRGSIYRAMLDAEASLTDGLWQSTGWRRVRLENGEAKETPLREAIA